MYQITFICSKTLPSDPNCLLSFMGWHSAMKALNIWASNRSAIIQIKEKIPWMPLWVRVGKRSPKQNVCGTYRRAHSGNSWCLLFKIYQSRGGSWASWWFMWINNLVWCEGLHIFITIKQHLVPFCCHLHVQNNLVRVIGLEDGQGAKLFTGWGVKAGIASRVLMSANNKTFPHVAPAERSITGNGREWKGMEGSIYLWSFLKTAPWGSSPTQTSHRRKRMLQPSFVPYNSILCW